MSDVGDAAAVDGEDRVEIEDAISDLIAQLSLATEAPTEFDATGRSFDPDEINFETAAWMERLADVQGWLRLSDELIADDQGHFLGKLAEGLGFDDVGFAVESVDGRQRLTEAGLDRLKVRLEQAVRLQSEFLADVEEDGGSQASATTRWREAWEDDLEDEEASGPVSAKADTWAINEFSDRATRNKLNLSPSYQRGDVWPTSDAQMLIESILRGIPLPSVIILKPAEADARYEVVDGKQRLTTILRFIGKHPQAIEKIKEQEKLHGDGLLELFESDYPAFRRKWKNLLGEQLTSAKEREYYFPFKLRTASPALRGDPDLITLEGKYYTQIKDRRLRIADDDVEIRELFERQTPYKIPLIEYSKASPKQIHEVFKLYNKQGKHLNAEEIRNAVYHDVDFMRAILVVAGDNKDVDIVAPFLRQDWEELSEMSAILYDYGVGTARYRRTKVVSWLTSMLFVDSMEEGKPKKLSTSPHIDSMFERIRNDTSDPLRQHDTIREAFELLLLGMRSHAAVNAWAPNFKNPTSGSNWQELQLIASVLGVTIAASILEAETEDRLESVAPSLLEKTSTEEWRRPRKATTGTQWDYLARISMWVVEALGVDLAEASAALEARFGHSSVATLRSVAAEPRPY